MARSTVHYADNKTNTILKALHNKLRPAGTPVQRVEYIIELLLLRIFEVKVKRDDDFKPLRKLFGGDNDALIFSDLLALTGNQALEAMNKKVFPFYGSILGKARSIYKNKNLPQKVQDQLVLIAEVFSNSSFSNNVKNGNLHEILSLVSDIDEERLLKTDLLGDAIESALSEQGGTKDVGLYRTPDHIRQMMVAMVDPNFKDTIFDPACGTGGFLFDAFQYVMEKIGKDDKWPGQKAHKEIKEFFRKYLKETEADMPSGSMAHTFYRIGISGIEYLGMIRKMAAINLYIRGLNPANIEQGDSLHLYNPSVEASDKSVVIANPPFGAKLDQPAYPNVWEEYPKTDSTTLFVKLMFNHLKDAGRCAVVVSEGFLTWDNEAAKEMRKLLLEEANLKAVISLPQGVFVSKNGQGAKTSILYFEKGAPTKNIWFYKITNDGYSMGVNRKEITGCQIPEVLELFIKYVKNGKIPPKTKNSFVIPVEWIRQIDPRLKERIIDETTNQQKGKFSEKREKEVKKLDEKLKKRKIAEKEYKEKILQFDNAIENKIQNEIAKRIEKAHAYSFNLQNYRSNLSADQIKSWQESVNGAKIKNTEDVEPRYKSLLSADLKEGLQILASFNPESALEMDIVREYLNKVDKEDKKVQKLEEILKEAQKYEKVSLRELLKDLSEERKFVVDEERVYFEPTISTKKNTISIGNEARGKDLKVKKRIRLQKGDLVVGLLHTQNGSFAICDQDYASTGTFIPFEINKSEVSPDYLFHNLGTAFKKLGLEDATGRENYKVDNILDLQIPLPPPEVQEEIVEKIERQRNIIDGCENILKSLYPTFPVDESWTYETADRLVDLFQGLAINAKTRHLIVADGDTPLLRIKDLISGKPEQYVNIKDVPKQCIVSNDDLIYTRTGQVGLVFRNKSGVLHNNSFRIVVKSDKIIKDFLFWYLSQVSVRNKIIELASRATQPDITHTLFYTLRIPVPPIEVQEKIISQMDDEMKMRERIDKLQTKAEETTASILEEVWGK